MCQRRDWHAYTIFIYEHSKHLPKKGRKYKYPAYCLGSTNQEGGKRKRRAIQEVEKEKREKGDLQRRLSTNHIFVTTAQCQEYANRQPNIE